MSLVLAEKREKQQRGLDLKGKAKGRVGR